ncbi:MAG: UDP-N-acetylmuramoyl-tripeptide--D-alanyl-D-alanine ligase [Thermodesulfobacteriota bacterium]
MRATFTIPEILSVTSGALVQNGAWDAFCGVSTDSRTCQTGELFIPLSGERHDGHDFIPKAVHRGARGVLVEKRIFVGTGLKPAPTVPREITVIAVNDALTALGDLARAWRARFKVPVVGITGSCGKTTTKEMIAAVLAPAFRVLKNRLNLNNLIGMPLTLLGLEGTHEAAVVEMGMNAFGEIHRLTQIARPTVGVLTNVHPAHTAGVGDIAGVARAKGELMYALNHGASLVYNADDPWVARLAQNFRGPRLGFGLCATAHLRAWERQSLGRNGQTACLSFKGQAWPLTLAAPGLHMLYNALAATAVGLLLGLAPQETAAALGGFQTIHRRSQVVTLASGIQLLNDCYNANPGSMAMALSTLMELRDSGRAAAALGDMLELGEGAAAEHQALGRLAAKLGLDLLVTYGSHRQDVADGAVEAGLSPARIFPVKSQAEGAQILKELLAPGDWLLVKGSRSMHMEGLIDRLEIQSSNR